MAIWSFFRRNENILSLVGYELTDLISQDVVEFVEGKIKSK